MKKILFVLLIFLTVSCIQKRQTGSYTINGSIVGINSGKIFLQCSEAIDTALIENGKFTFKGKLKEPCLCKISIEGIEHEKEFYLENSTITFNGQLDSLEKSVIKGSKLEQDKIEYEALLKKIDLKFNIDSIEAENEKADEVKKAELDKIYKLYENEKLKNQRQFVKDHPGSYLAVIILRDDIDWSFTSANEYNEYVSLLDTSFNKYKKMIELKRIVVKMAFVEVGKTAPDFEMNDINGNLKRLSESYQKSKYLLLDFWGSTCGPCRRENVNVRKAYDKFHNKGFEIFSVSIDTKKEFWLKAIEKDKLIWTNVCCFKDWEENDVFKTYAVRQIPHNIILDNTGKIIAQDLQGNDLITKLNKFFN